MVTVLNEETGEIKTFVSKPYAVTFKNESNREYMDEMDSTESFNYPWRL